MKNINTGTIRLLKLKKMKQPVRQLVVLMILTMTLQFSMAQTAASNDGFIQESKSVLTKMIEKSTSLQFYYNQSYAYAIFPKVTKVGVSIGIAGGKGILFKNHIAVSKSKLRQATFGLQLGAQKYSEILFFQSENDFEKFINKKCKFDGQASVIAIKKGASADLSYSDGVAIFTQVKGGLMLEASIGAQHFYNTPF